VSLESILRRDRRIVMGGLVLLVAVSWGYLLAGAGMEMEPVQWTPGYALLMFMMWWIMMGAMMLPSAAPVILLVAALNRRARPERRPYGTAGSFATGYLIAWAGYSLAAVAAQWWLTQNGLLSAMMQTTTAQLAGAFLIAAGLWQFTPMKDVCLRHCRSPVQFLTERRRKGNRGGLAMGMEHGTYCLGCCWLLMALLFVGGVMSLIWILGLTLYVVGEKLLPAGERMGRLAGAALLLWGLALIGGLT